MYTAVKTTYDHVSCESVDTKSKRNKMKHIFSQKRVLEFVGNLTEAHRFEKQSIDVEQSLSYIRAEKRKFYMQTLREKGCVEPRRRMYPSGIIHEVP